MLSPDLFKVFVNDLVGLLKGADAGIDFGRVQLSSLMFADDLVMMSSSERGLQRQMSVLSEWCDRNGIHVHPQNQADGGERVLRIVSRSTACPLTA